MKRPKLLRDLPRRAYLTLKYHGWREFFFRLLTFPLRFVGLERGFRARLEGRAELRRVRAWYRANGRPVTIVMPTYGSSETTMHAVRRLQRTVDRTRTRIVVVDDGSEPEHRAPLRSLQGVMLDLAPENAGFAATVNRGIRLADSADDIVVLNNDVMAHRGWLERLQRAAYLEDRVGIVGPKLLYPDGRIQSAGSLRNPGAPEWFDHRYRFKSAHHGPANVRDAALAMTGACIYVKRSLIDELGPLDEGFGMGYEDVDYSLRAWQAGHEVLYEPDAELTHLESVTRGVEVGERELSSQNYFWSKWGAWFDRRNVMTGDRQLRVVYVTEDTGVGGGHRDIFEHLNRLQARGHDATLYTLGTQPDWFRLETPVKSFGTYEQLAAALASVEALKVATWWGTAPFVWRASVTRGIPVYFVQDIETSYYGDNKEMQDRVLASYRQEFRYMTISSWNRDRLADLDIQAELIPPGIDLDIFRPLGGSRRDDVLLALGRSNPLKNLPLTIESWKQVDPRPELWLFGIEPELGPRHGARYIEAPNDEEVNELFNEATIFLQTSRHEGFCLPPLEAMAAGTPVVCTDAHGNRDFCRDGENCLLVEPHPDAVSAAIARVLREPTLRQRLLQGGFRTARDYAWERRIDDVEAFLRCVAESGAPAASSASPAASPGSPSS
jgi:GT2 family glycosyltransferase